MSAGADSAAAASAPPESSTAFSELLPSDLPGWWCEWLLEEIDLEGELAPFFRDKSMPRVCMYVRVKRGGVVETMYST